MKKSLLKNGRGASIAELLIGMTITMTVIGAFINLLSNTHKTYYSDSLRQEMSLTGRVSMDEVQREAMNAGTGLPGLLPAVQVFDGGSTEPDTVTFIYVPQTKVHLKFATSPPPNKAANVMKLSKESDIDSLDVGDKLIVFDETDCNIIEITDINSSSNTVIFVPPVGVNTPDGLAKKYDPAKTTITRVTLRSMTVDKTDAAHPTLVKFSGSTLLGRAAYDIENLQVVMHFADGDTASVADDTDADDTNDPINLNAVEIKVMARSSRADQRNPEGDHYWRQVFTSFVAPRSMIL
jgi:Tfp pilus assembly protein PilW